MIFRIRHGGSTKTTTEDFIEEIITKAISAYKKNSKGSLIARKLDRHEDVEIQGYIFNCWREYVCFKIGELIIDKVPTIKIEIELAGNETVIRLEMSDSEQQELNRKLHLLVKNMEVI